MKRHIVIHLGLAAALTFSLVFQASAKAVPDPNDRNRNTRMKYLLTNPDLLKKRVNVDRSWMRSTNASKTASGTVAARPIRKNERLLRALEKQKKATKKLVPKVKPKPVGSGSTVTQ